MIEGPAFEQPAGFILASARVDQSMRGETDRGLRDTMPQLVAFERDAQDLTLLKRHQQQHDDVLGGGAVGRSEPSIQCRIALQQFVHVRE